MQPYRAGLLGLCLAVAGCGGPGGRPMTQDDATTLALNDVGELYRLYTAEKKKPPTGTADFSPMGRMSPMGLRAIEAGDVVVRLGASLPDIGEEPGKGPGDEVLAYQKDVPASGGHVMMLDRTIRTMTPEEFRAAKLAGTASSSASIGDKAKNKGR
jgi:hypothetical protein